MRSPSRSGLVASLGHCGFGAMVGGLSALGRPGGDLLIVHVLAALAVLTLAARTRSFARAFALGAGFGCGEGAVTFAGSVSWGLVVPVLLTLVGAASHHIPLILWTRFVARSSVRWARLLGTVCVSALLAQLGELIGFPSKLATVFVTPLTELIAGARLVGADLVTGLLEATLVEVALVLARSPWSLRSATPALRAGLPGLLVLASLSALAHLSAPGPTGNIQVGIPQVNAGSTYYQSRLLAPSVAEQFDQTFAQLLLPLESSDLLVTTETYDGRFGLMLPPVRDAWSQRSQRLRQAAVVTSYLVDTAGGKVNAAGVFASDGRFLGAHEKVDLAPFGEAPLAAGTQGYRVFEIFPKTRLGVAICLESYLRKPSLELVRAGANLLAVTTSDVTFGSGIMVFEHLAMSQLRAVELGRSLIWASNAGPSGVIDRFGRFRGGPFRESAAVREVASTYSGQTPYVRFFELWWSLPWFGFVIALRRLWSTQQSVDFPPERTDSRGHWLRAGCLVAVPALVLAAPAVVELRRGDPARAAEAIAELGRPPRILSAPDPFMRFRTSTENSATAAVAYLLEYYGLDASVIPSELPPSATVKDVQARLASVGIQVREINPLETELRVGAVLRLKDGTWGVVDAQEADSFRLVAPHSGRAGDVNTAELRQLVQPTGLIPRWNED